MTVGIIVHSQSGNTASCAKHIAEKLKQENIDYEVNLLRTVGSMTPFSRRVQLAKIPDISDYSVLLIGGPVLYLNASPAVLAFLNSLDTFLKGKIVIPFVTHSLPLKWLGATQALTQITNTLETLMADVVEGESFFFFFKPRNHELDERSNRIVSHIKKIGDPSYQCSEK